MTNISKQPLSQQTTDKLFFQLTKLFADVSQQRASNFLDNLFTDSEKIMFIKRLAVVLLISKGQSTYRIAKLLSVSDATVRTIKQKYDQGAYGSIISATQKKAFDSEKFWKTLEVILRGGMPSMGKDRWKGFGFTD